MNKRRRLLMSVAEDKNLMRKAQYVKAKSIATSSVISGSNENTWLFMIPIKPNTAYLVRKKQPLGALFRIGFITDTSLTTGQTVSPSFIGKTETEHTILSAGNSAYLVMTLYSGTAEGDIHEAVANITEVYEV